MSTLYAILIVEQDGETHYIRHGVNDGPVAIYTSRVKAEHDAAFWRDGLGDEVQGISVVRYRAKKALA